MTYDVFISYKRKGTSSIAAAYLYDILQQKGYNVFFDRRELRSGKFDEQLLTHITNAEDVIILLEEGSLESWFSMTTEKIDEKSDESQEAPYKSDWFCREVMHALSLKGKNIIPILLNGFKMPPAKSLPPEMAGLSVINALSFDSSETEEFCEKYLFEQGFLKSRPKNLSLSRRFQSKAGVVGCFLIYSDAANFDFYECGEKIATLTDNEDERHPFRYPVSFAGEHRFNFLNNDTLEDVTVCCNIEANCQKYIQVQFAEKQNVWELTDVDIAAVEDPERLYRWGCGLYEGNVKHNPDFELSLDCLKRSSELGCTDAMAFIRSQNYDLVTEKKAPRSVAFQWFYTAALEGEPFSQYLVGYMYHNGKGVSKDISAALDWYAKASEQGVSPAQRRLADMYYDGTVVENDLQKAFELYSKAAEQGNSIALWKLGDMYRKGNGVAMDQEAAFRCYEKSAKKGNLSGMTLLGNVYYRGEGVEKNIDKAVELYSKAAEQDFAPAQYFLGRQSYKGEGVVKNLSKAVELFTQSAEQEFPLAFNSLAWTYYLLGEYKKALPWAEKAVQARPNDPAAADTLEKVRGKLAQS